MLPQLPCLALPFVPAHPPAPPTPALCSTSGSLARACARKHVRKHTHTNSHAQVHGHFDANGFWLRPLISHADIHFFQTDPLFESEAVKFNVSYTTRLTTANRNSELDLTTWPRTCAQYGQTHPTQVKNKSAASENKWNDVPTRPGGRCREQEVDA